MTELNIRELEALVINTSDLNGFGWDDYKNCPFIIPAKLALIHTEVTELINAMNEDNMLEEMADIIIRTLDLTGRLIWKMGEDAVQNGLYTDLQSTFTKRGFKSPDIYGAVLYTDHASDPLAMSVEHRFTWLRHTIDEAIEDYRNKNRWFMFHLGDIILMVTKIFNKHRVSLSSNMEQEDLYKAIIAKNEKNLGRAHKHGKRV